MSGFAIYECALGFFRIDYVDDAVIALNKVIDKFQDFGKKTPLTEAVFVELNEYFAGKRKTFTFKYTLQGTEFQKKVWAALCDIPYGETRSYKELAIAVGNPKACRAVGMANNKNPISIAVPCHRVIGSDGKLVGYASGLDMKIYLLKLEATHV